MKMDHGIYVNMAVKCIGKMCKDCPNLHVVTNISESIDKASGWEKRYETDLRCSNLQRCLQLYNMMEDDYKKWGASDDERT